MIFLIACILIYSNEMSGAWYLIAAIIWVGSVIMNNFLTALLYASMSESLGKKIMQSVPGIRGTVKNENH
ncbi:MAG: hypothetical protein ACR2QF_00945 [Geminicoccaceae bacterium]